MSAKYTETVNAELNGKKMLDMDVVFGKDTAYVAALTMRAPQPVSFSSNGEFGESAIRGDVNINWNAESQDSNVRIAAALNDGSDRFTKRKDMSMTVTLPRKTVTVTSSLSTSSIAMSSSGNIIIDGVTKFGIDYETSAKNRRNNKEQSNT
ncbi:uncharacterized protein LOC110440674, partial [Mizuhopecten yessoensis]|uniref:uncharacterized protein LOC110440674 n=1 Tax=Mizuhopecten yessoensis TaxID=6573 RepID=UPI000B45B48F